MALIEFSNALLILTFDLWLVVQAGGVALIEFSALAMPLLTLMFDLWLVLQVMQLFSIGLWQLNMDGTQKLDASQEPLPTYDNTHIVSFAKAWTGFDLQPWRSNLESPSGHTSSNFIDPMIIHARPGQTTADSQASRRDLYVSRSRSGGLWVVPCLALSALSLSLSH